MEYRAPALELGVKLIELLAAARSPLRLSEIATAIDTNKNTATRLLATLKRARWVECEEPGPRYRLSLVPFSIVSAVANRMSLKEEAVVPLHELWKETGESVYLDVLFEDKALCLEHFDATSPVKIAGRVGGQYPLHCSAPGKALLAHAGEEVLSRVLRSGPKRFTENTITDHDALRAEMEKVRKQGFALDNEEYGRGVLCVAAPVFDMTGAAVGTIGASTITVFYTIEEFTEQVGKKVVKTAAQVSRRLGYSQ